MINKLIPLLTFVVLFYFSCSEPRPKQLNNNIIQLEDSLNNIMSGSKIPGFGIAIVKEDSVIYTSGFGYANLRKKDPYTISTIQPIASISKTFIGLALMKAIDQGHFNLETNINDVLPFKIINPFQPNSEIKIKHLVTHTSGLVDNDSVFGITYTTKQKSEMDFKIFFREYYTKPGKYYSEDNFCKAKPGEEFNYSNIAASLVAYMIELKSGMSFPEYTSKYILEPLQMNDSHWFYDSSKAKSYSKLYEITKQTAPEYTVFLNSDSTVKPYTDVTYPDGKLYSSIQDMTKYLKAMIMGYSKNKGLISESAFQTLFEKQFTKTNTPTYLNEEEPNRAVFWAYDSKDRVVHTGSDFGVTTFITFNPKTKIGHVIFFNTAFDGENNEKAIADIKLIFERVKRFEDELK